MNFNKENLEKLLSLSDEDLKTVIENLASKSGIDTKNLRISDEELAKIKSALRMSDEKELKDLAMKFRNEKLNNGRT